MFIVLRSTHVMFSPHVLLGLLLRKKHTAIPKRKHPLIKNGRNFVIYPHGMNLALRNGVLLLLGLNAMVSKFTLVGSLTYVLKRTLNFMNPIPIGSLRVGLCSKDVMLRMKITIGLFSLKLHHVLLAWKQVVRPMHSACCLDIPLK